MDGVTHTFGNYGTLFMNAMTWWDHETESVWSQPWGASIKGELIGERLTLLPFSLVPWSTWRDQHPETLVMVDERNYIKFTEYSARDEFVVGVAIGEAAQGFYYRSVANSRVANEYVGEFPLVVFADSETREINAFIRVPVGDEVERLGYDGQLTFVVGDSGEVRDLETDSTWDIVLGVAVDGPLRKSLLQRAPFIISSDWAWEDFYPSTTFWGAEDGAVPQVTPVAG